jgi:hypothetical protein
MPKHRHTHAPDFQSLRRQLAELERKIAEHAQRQAEQIAALEHLEWLVTGHECRRLDKLRPLVRRRVTALAEGAPERFPREMHSGILKLASLSHDAPLFDAAYTLLSFAGKRERLRFLRAGRAEREAILRQILVRGGVRDDRGRFQEILR